MRCRCHKSSSDKETREITYVLVTCAFYMTTKPTFVPTFGILLSMVHVCLFVRKIIYVRFTVALGRQRLIGEEGEAYGIFSSGANQTTLQIVASSFGFRNKCANDATLFQVDYAYVFFFLFDCGAASSSNLNWKQIFRDVYGGGGLREVGSCLNTYLG